MFDIDPSAAPSVAPPEIGQAYRPADRYSFIEREGGRLRVAAWDGPAAVRGTVLLFGGRGEFIEKYATEVISELLGRGFAVLSMDWRGQGLSSRSLADRDKGYIDDFATYVDDLRLFLERALHPDTPRPVFALAHSMGGHSMLRLLAESGPGPIDAAMLVSPMTGLPRQALSRRILAITPDIDAVNERYVCGNGPYATTSHSFAGNDLTHDERRFRFTDAWFSADPRLTLGGPTLGWARQALRSIQQARSMDYFKRVSLPVVLLSAGEDSVVDIESHAEVISRLTNGKRIVLEGARHEIMMETDDIRAQFWKSFDGLTRA